jgi:hypothetical protein
VIINGVPTQVGFTGNASANLIYGPGLNNMDLGIHKTIDITESKTLEFRAEAFNAFNHVSLQAPNTRTFLNSASGATITQAFPMRQMQFALKFLF